MSALAESLMMAGGSNSAVGSFNGVDYVDDVFSTYLYTGNGTVTGSEQTITNGIDLSTSDKTVTFISRLQASDVTVSDWFGYSVALSSDGTTMAVGARRDDNSSGVDAGSVYIYTRVGSVWSQQARLQASDGAANDMFGLSVSLSADGNTLAAGVPYNDTGAGLDSGSVYIFTRTGTTWSQHTQIQAATNASTNDLFGHTVSLSAEGTTLAISAHYDASNGSNSGSVYIFTLMGGVWTQHSRLQASDALANDQFGYSVSLSADGSTLAVGANGDDNAYTDSGSVYIFKFSGGVWSQQTRLQASDAGSMDNFGYSVSLSADGNTLAIGAYLDDDTSGDVGSVYIFTRTGNAWSQQTRLLASDRAPSDQFGNSVSISADGNTLVVGAHQRDSGAIANIGACYIFTRLGGSWVQQGRLLANDSASGDWFGSVVGVSADGNTLAVGAFGDDNSGGGDAGSVYTYSISNNTRTNRGGMVWIKNRGAASNHVITDTTRGVNAALYTQATSSQQASASVTAFNTNGFDISGSATDTNLSGASYASWTFRKAPKFFDAVAYTGDGTSGRHIPHSLGIRPGWVIVKATSTTSEWAVSANYNTINGGYANGLGINLTNPAYSGISGGNVWIHNATHIDLDQVPMAGGAVPNLSGVQYIAYVFAHDVSADGIIQCGSYTTDSSGNATVNLGWEPQLVLHKSSTTTTNWVMQDVMRGMSDNGPAGNGVYLHANSSALENGSAAPGAIPTANGFNFHQGAHPNHTFIYLAIRRPNKPLKTGTQVYNAITRTGTGTAATITGVGFPPDVIMHLMRVNTSSNNSILDRVRGRTALVPSSTTPETSQFTSNDLATYDMDGFRVGGGGFYTNINKASTPEVFTCLRRAPGFMDVVCYAGTGVVRTVPHSLGVVPELMIVKGRTGNNGNGDWICYHVSLGASVYIPLNFPMAAYSNRNEWNYTTPTKSGFTIGVSNGTNNSSTTYIAYLFASFPGISKVGIYVGNGTSQTIPCGFTTGARFILIKRADAVGDWFMWNTALGVVAGNDPHLSLNTAVSEVTTDDSVDPDVTGFIVNQNTATNINVALGEYIFLAIA